ncbi:winged helix-turn-helix domain-containing protein [Stutzerimonas balearica]|nr:winged helix-turn-helix domain-containing protein [Stutzerimonas balearica]
MSVPTYDQFIEPILRYLAATPEGAAARDAHEAAADALNLSEAQRQELIASGQATYKNRAGWAHDRLKRAGLSSSAKRGYWKLTDAGINLCRPAPHPSDSGEGRTARHRLYGRETQEPGRCHSPRWARTACAGARLSHC